MELEELRTYCLSKPGVTEGMKWGAHLTFMVAEKMFVIFGLDETPVTCSFKVDDEDFELLSERTGMKPAPYLAKNKWIWAQDISLMGSEEWKSILDKAYEIIKAKLPKRVQDQLQ